MEVQGLFDGKEKRHLDAYEYFWLYETVFFYYFVDHINYVRKTSNFRVFAAATVDFWIDDVLTVFWKQKEIDTIILHTGGVDFDSECGCLCFRG